MYTLIMVAVSQVPDSSIPITDPDAGITDSERSNKLILNAFMVVGLTGLFILTLNLYLKRDPKKHQVKDYSI